MKDHNPLPGLFAILLASLMFLSAASTADVKITPLGSQEGEFCQLDRALILEDRMVHVFSTIPVVPSPARMIPGWVRSTPYWSVICTATTSATSISPLSVMPTARARSFQIGRAHV